MDKKKEQYGGGKNTDKESELVATLIQLNIWLLERTRRLYQEMQLEFGEEESRHSVSSNTGA